MSFNTKATPRTKAHPQKIIRCSTKYYKLLSRGVNITVVIYYPQLRRLTDAIQEKHQKLMLLHDNAHPRWANLAKTTFHPPYSPHLAPSDLTLSSIYQIVIKEHPFRMKMCSEHDFTTSLTHNHEISESVKSKNYSRQTVVDR